MTAWDKRLRDALAAFNRGELDEAARYMDDDVQWGPRLAAVDAPMLVGKEQVVRIWREQIEALGVKFEVLSTELLGPGLLLTELRASGTGTVSGIAVEDRYWAVWVFRGGKAVRIDQYDTREQALADLEP